MTTPLQHAIEKILRGEGLTHVEAIPLVAKIALLLAQVEEAERLRSAIERNAWNDGQALAWLQIANATLGTPAHLFVCDAAEKAGHPVPDPRLPIPTASERARGGQI